MRVILDAFREAFLLIIRLDREFLGVLWLSLVVSGIASVLGALIGIPVGALLSEFDFRGKRTLLTVVHALMGLPPVVAGLLVLLVISRSGPLGSLELVFTPAAMVLVQTVLAVPIVAGFTHASLLAVDPRLKLQAVSLGATRFQAVLVKMAEARAGMVAAVVGGFGRVIAEVGAVMMVGGNIRGQTRVLTTHLFMMARQGRFEVALADGIVLIAVALAVNAVLTSLQAEKGRSEIERRVTGYPT